MLNFYKPLIWATTLLALCVVILGAYVRLSDAGLGCPDWPGCYGYIGAPVSDAQVHGAFQAFPDKPVETHKAWKEMFHRYFAGALGILILIISIAAWAKRAQLKQSPKLSTLLLVLVIFQAALGMWTVTLLLKPVIVTLHLLGGLATLALLFCLALRQSSKNMTFDHPDAHRLRWMAKLGLIILLLQITLGGWTSSNYAALVCGDFPLCHGEWFPPMDFSNAFHVIRDLGRSAQGELLTREALTAIQWSHRLGALATFLYLGWLAHKMIRVAPLKQASLVLLVLLVLQVSLGIANVLLALPLVLAVMHNAVAALLLLTLVFINFRLSQHPQRV